MTTSPGPDKGLFALAAAAICCYAAHAGYYLYRRQPEHLLWICHLGALVLGIGLLMSQGTLNAIGTLWLLVGLPLWIHDLTRGGNAPPSSFLTHVGGPLIGLIGVKKLGMPTGLWWKVLVGIVPIYGLSRFLTSPEANVNLSHRMYPGSEAWCPSYPVYAASLAALYAGAALLFQSVSRRLGCKPLERP